MYLLYKVRLRSTKEKNKSSEKKFFSAEIRNILFVEKKRYSLHGGMQWDPETGVPQVKNELI
jgi:hypothetical protein